MKIPLSSIKPSSKPIRTTWDEESMNNLKWSLMEEGQVEPIGLHENHNGYVIIWGHRRVEAARRASWKEIEAVIVKQDEVDNLIQAGIENLAGEEMSTDDKANWAQRLIDLGLSQNEIARRSSVSKETIRKWLIYRSEKEQGVTMVTKERAGESGYRKIVEISAALGNDLEAKKAIAAKSSKDELTTVQTRAVAEAYRDAPTPEVKAAVLRTPIISRDTSADILRRSINRVELETGEKIIKEQNDFEKEREERREMEAWDFAVKDFLDFTKRYSEIASKGIALVKYNKYSPEAAKYAIRKIDSLIDLLKSYRDVLETVK